MSVEVFDMTASARSVNPAPETPTGVGRFSSGIQSDSFTLVVISSISSSLYELSVYLVLASVAEISGEKAPRWKDLTHLFLKLDHFSDGES